MMLGENQVPVQDLLTALKEIYLMREGKLAGKVIVDSVSFGNIARLFVCMCPLCLRVFKRIGACVCVQDFVCFSTRACLWRYTPRKGTQNKC